MNSTYVKALQQLALNTKKWRPPQEYVTLCTCEFLEEWNKEAEGLGLVQLERRVDPGRSGLVSIYISGTEIQLLKIHNKDGGVCFSSPGGTRLLGFVDLRMINPTDPMLIMEDRTRDAILKALSSPWVVEHLVAD